ncbi:hypothetical protein L207DRAFT_551318 [Hyaloscypha variabilis F]|uniref:Uncharacterized protein n=1 Tax=Hyaloscypha variabilis (strain UAMH 11265 / GT02V1 / F) TaxID=1149755 RepID=A0A2J6S557_HYAVF|nr:hypothetical protein L207DRAFT_551318 [Hyaloscypha variabilis F]
MPLTADSRTASEINLIARFLAHDQINDLSSHKPVDCIVICASAVLYQAEKLFQALESRPDLAKTVVLCGGIGHSTPLIYEAVARSSKYHALAKEVIGLPESRVLQKILERYFDISAITSAGCKILIEDKSTNCGANAFQSHKVLEAAGVPIPKTCIIIQDPTMALRTIASFEKKYSDLETPPKFLSCPIFVPEVRVSRSEFQYVVGDVSTDELWDTSRFFDLIMGEIPRLRDDEAGYGPNGKKFISHVDIPREVEDAWQRLENVLGNRR